MSTISELERELRDFINAPRRHRELYANEHLFGQLCSSLDVMGDTEAAMDEYLATVRAEAPSDESYLRIYGILQALYLQQDALQHLAESLGVQYSLPENVHQIREVRNDAVGHPTRRGRGPGKAFNHINRASLEASGFEMLSHRPGSPTVTSSVDIPSLIQTQRVAVTAALETLIDSERQRERNHRLQFRDKSLSSVFPEALPYYLEKIGESISGRKDEPGLVVLSLLEESIAEFKTQLAERNELPAHTEEINHRFGPATNSIERLQSIISGRTTELTWLDAEAFLFRLTHAMRRLKEFAKVLDDQYMKDPVLEH